MADRIPLQPNFNIINQAVGQLTAEIAKLPNIGAIAQGNALIEAVQALRGDMNGRFDRIELQIRASFVPSSPLFSSVLLTWVG
jgi:hypothetical protein